MISVFIAGSRPEFIPSFVEAEIEGESGTAVGRQKKTIFRQNIALVLPDMNMQVMNGEQTYAILQEIEPEVKVIVSSSLSQAEARLRFRERELPTYLQKPYDLSTLLNAVQTELAMA